MILSASRRTDIPAFYSEWFVNRLKEGFLDIKNPFNERISKIHLSPTDFIVFWTKNPEEMLKYLDTIDNLGYKYYFQFTITSYDVSMEPNVPRKGEIIETFKRLSDRIGSDKVLWRYDPIIITDNFTIEYHLKWFSYIANLLEQYTHKCTISFVDMYNKCKKNLKGINVQPINIDKKILIAETLSVIASIVDITVESCSEDIGIKSGKCIDDKLIEQITGSKTLAIKDKTQRKKCNCVQSFDIGTYNTCKHGCRYCYANFNTELVDANYVQHNKFSSQMIF